MGGVDWAEPLPLIARAQATEQANRRFFMMKQPIPQITPQQERFGEKVQIAE
jgi:hypothetical protein